MRLIKILFIIGLLCFVPGKINAKDNQIDISIIYSFDSSGSITIPAEGGEVSISFMMLRPVPYEILMDHINDSFSGSEDVISNVSISGYSGNIEGTLLLEFAANEDEERIITISSSQNSIDIIQEAHVSSVFTLSANKTTIMYGEDILFTLDGSTPSFLYDLLRDGVTVDRNTGNGSSITFHSTGAGSYTAKASRPSVIPMNGKINISYLSFYGYTHDFQSNEVMADCNGGIYRVRFVKNSSASDSELLRILSFYNSGNSKEWDTDIRVDYSQGEIVFSCGPNMGKRAISNNTWFRNASSNYLTILQPNGGSLLDYSIRPSEDGSSIVVSGSQPFVEYYLLKDGERTTSSLIGTGSVLYFSQNQGAGAYTVEASYKGVDLVMSGEVIISDGGALLNKDDNWILQETSTESTGLVNPIRDITFYNGLGDPEQIVNVGASPRGRNIVTPIEYDPVRHADAKTFLPYVSFKSSTSKEESPLQSQRSYYDLIYGSGEGECAYALKVYGASPVERVLAQTKPGLVYRNARKQVSYTYDSNSSLTVYRIDLDTDDNGIHVNGYYSPGELYAKMAEDEDGKILISYTDKLNRLVLSRAVSGDITQDTYYVYDGLSRLRWVIQPEGSERLQGQSRWTIDSQEARAYAFRYTYDGRGRLTETRFPGKEVEYTVFDPAGRPVARQDGNLRAQGRWLLVKYTKFGEEDSKYLTGTNSFSRAFLEDAFSTTATPTYVYSKSSNILIEHYYYDSYPSWAPNPGTESGIVLVSELINSPKGLLTGKEEADLSTLGNSVVRYSRSVFFYDKRGRLRQTVELSPDEIMLRESIRYDYLGNIIRRMDAVNGTNVTPKTLEETYSYDNRSRLLASSASIRNSTATVTYQYDDLGRLTTKDLGNITQIDTYNLQGWLTSRTASIGRTTVYSQTLQYYSPSLGTTPQYGGNISEWGVSNGNTSGIYCFTYDGFGRLTSSQRHEGISSIGRRIPIQENSFIEIIDGSISPSRIDGLNSFTEKDITYDKNGNILTMKRYGSSSLLPQDDFSYSYNGNQLFSLSGSTNMSFQYDANGNMIFDGENRYSFNLIDKVSQVLQDHRLKAEYHFFADGEKYKVLDGNGEGLTYIGPFVYTHSGDFESVIACGGDARFMNAGRTISPYYYITDHLGSVRVIADEGGNIVERNDYYPYGSRHTSGAKYPTLESNRQKFSGKEIQSMVDLPLHDFGARMYTSSNMRWMTVDPLCEKYYSISPYAYCAGNPVNLVDPDGRECDEYYSSVNGKYLGKDAYGYSLRLMNPKDFNNISKGKTNVQDIPSIQELRASSRMITAQVDKIESDAQKVADCSRADRLEHQCFIVLDRVSASIFTVDGPVGENSTSSISYYPAPSTGCSFLDKPGGLILIGQIHGHPDTNMMGHQTLKTMSSTDIQTAQALQIPIWGVDAMCGTSGDSMGVHVALPTGEVINNIRQTGAPSTIWGYDSLRIWGNSEKPIY